MNLITGLQHICDDEKVYEYGGPPIGIKRLLDNSINKVDSIFKTAT